MKKYLFIILLAGVGFGQTKENIADYYLGNRSNYITLDEDVRIIIDAELSKIYSDLDSVLSNELNLKTEKTKRKFSGRGFNKNEYYKAALKNGIQAGTKAASDLANYFYYNIYDDVKIVKNRRIPLINSESKFLHYANKKDLFLYTKKANWLDLVKKYGYAKLGEMGVSKEQIKKFNLNYYLCQIELVDNKRCIIFSKYYGNNFGYEYYDIKPADSTSNYGSYIIEPINWNILSGLEDPKIIFNLPNKKFSLDLYDIEPMSKKSVNKRFIKYKTIIYNMLDDLLDFEQHKNKIPKNNLISEASLQMALYSAEEQGLIRDLKNYKRVGKRVKRKFFDYNPGYDIYRLKSLYRKNLAEVKGVVSDREFEEIKGITHKIYKIIEKEFERAQN